MQAAHGMITVSECIVSVRAPNDDLATAIDLHARASRIYLDARSPSSIARQKLFDRVVNSIEIYSIQLADLAAALSSMADGRIGDR